MDLFLCTRTARPCWLVCGAGTTMSTSPSPARSGPSSSGTGKEIGIYSLQCTCYIQYIQLQHIEKDLCRSKGKVRLCCLGTKFIQFHAMLAILHPDCWKNMMNSSFSSFILVQLIFFFIPSWCKIASAARNSVPHTKATTFALSSVYVHCTCCIYIQLQITQ